MTALTLLPEDCPRFDHCNAAVCPLDPGWRKTVHLKGEPVCYYLRATGKSGAEQHLAHDPVFAAVKALVSTVCEHFSAIRHVVERASRSGFVGQQTWLQSKAPKTPTAPEQAPEG